MYELVADFFFTIFFARFSSKPLGTNMLSAWSGRMRCTPETEIHERGAIGRPDCVSFGARPPIEYVRERENTRSIIRPIFFFKFVFILSSQTCRRPPKPRPSLLYHARRRRVQELLYTHTPGQFCFSPPAVIRLSPPRRAPHNTKTHKHR